MKIRQGRKVGRTLYLQLGPEPSDDDVLIGLVDTTAYAALIVRAVNALAVADGGDDQWEEPTASR